MKLAYLDWSNLMLVMLDEAVGLGLVKQASKWLWKSWMTSGGQPLIKSWASRSQRSEGEVSGEGRLGYLLMVVKSMLLLMV